MNIKIQIQMFRIGLVLVIVSLACQGISDTGITPTTETNAGSSPANPPRAGASPVNLPEIRENQAGDPDSSENADRKIVSGGEKFVRGVFERPFNSDPMDRYFPYLDIVDTQGFKDDTWGYATISLSGTDANGQLPGNYAVELDLNKDGRGEWLILASNPGSTDWTVQGVQAWNDANGDVGGGVPMSADENQAGDGYEKLVLDQGNGDQSGEAWVRVTADDPRTITLAFRLSLIGEPDSFAMGAWAGSASLDPSLFDMNDHMTHIEAGSPLPDLFVYPLKELAEIDNTCRMAIGFVPSGNEPGLCQTVVQQEPGVVVGCTPNSNPAGMMNPCAP